MAKKVLNIITTVILVLLIALLILMFYARASGHTVSFFGFSFFRVSSASMEPTLMTGDIILVQKTSVTNIHKNDIVSYRGDEGEMDGKVVTHRVITEPENDNGTWFLQTQGDADGTVPDPKITSDQLVGKYLVTIPLLGYLYSFFLTPVGLVTIVSIILILFGYEMISLLVSYKSIDKLGVELEEELRASEVEKAKREMNQKGISKENEESGLSD